MPCFPFITFQCPGIDLRARRTYSFYSPPVLIPKLYQRIEQGIASVEDADFPALGMDSVQGDGEDVVQFGLTEGPAGGNPAIYGTGSKVDDKLEKDVMAYGTRRD